MLPAGYALVQSTLNPDHVLLRVDAGVLDCGQRKLPYPTYLGVLSRTTDKIDVWSPAGCKPRGYRAAARAALETARKHLHKEEQCK